MKKLNCLEVKCDKKSYAIIRIPELNLQVLIEQMGESNTPKIRLKKKENIKKDKIWKITKSNLTYYSRSIL